MYACNFLTVPPNAITTTVGSSGTAIAGMVYSLTCTVFKIVGGLINSPIVIWPTWWVAVTNGNGITVSDTIGDMAVTSTLTFDPLRTSHEGSFVCSGTLTSPALDTVLMPSTTEELEIQSKTTTIVYTMPFKLIAIIHSYSPCSLYSWCGHQCSPWSSFGWSHSSSHSHLHHLPASTLPLILI